MTTTHKRTQIINCFIEARKLHSYLEIGVNNSVNFNEITAARKVGVDPVNPASYSGTSDDFFAQNTETFDVIFIDGMHLKEYVMRDILNALKILNEGGIIFCHDMNPAIPEHATRVPQSHIKPAGYPEDWEHSPSDRISAWNGDVWETWVELRQTRPDLSMHVLSDGDQLGLIEIGSQQPITISDEITFDNLNRNRKRWLNPVSIEEYGRELSEFSWQLPKDRVAC